MNDFNLQPDVPTPKRGIRWGRILAWSISLLPVLIIASHALWGHLNERRLERNVAALKAGGEPTTPADLASAHVPDDQNAVIDLREAAGSIADRGSWKAFDELEAAPAVPLTEEELKVIKAIIAENSAAFASIERAVKKGKVDWQIKLVSPLIETDYLKSGDLNGARSVANLLKMSALEAHHAGDHRLLLQRMEELLFVAEAVDQLPFFVPRLVAIGIESMVIDLILTTTPDLKIGGMGGASREEVEGLVRRLLDEKEVWDRMRQSIRGERIMQQDAITSMINGKMSSQIGGLSLKDSAARPILFMNARVLLRQMTGMAEHLKDDANWPIYGKAVEWEPVEARDSPRFHFLVAQLTPANKGVLNHHFRAIADRRMAATALAIRLYMHDHEGGRPGALDELTPKYLPSLPSDPFAKGRAIGYRNDPAKPFLYTVAENGVDDDGRGMPPNQWGSRWGGKDTIFDLILQPRPVLETKPEELEETNPDSPEQER